MNEETKKRIAEFRFGVIHDLVGGRKLPRGEKERLLREKTSSDWEIPYSGRSYLSRSTILNWVKKYEESGRRLESLYPEEREDKGKTRALDEETALALVNLRKEFRGATLPVILQKAKERGIIAPHLSISPATLYRLFKNQGLEEEPVPPDRRRFEAELPNDIWQSDSMHGPKVEVAGKMKQSYLFAFIDDRSRLIPHAEFYLQERLDSYLDALRKALSKRGLPRKLYVDNGPTFRSHQLSHITAELGIALIHSRPYQPEGRGKIERWFKTVRMQFLSTLPEGLTLEEINDRLQKWIEEVYQVTKHSTTGETPLNRYLKQVHLVRCAPSNLTDYFRQRALRKVDKARTVSLLGRIYEAPLELIGKTVTLLYQENDPARIEVFYLGKSYGMLLPLNPQLNCRIKREHHLPEIVPEEREEHQEGEEPYRGGMLFYGDEA